MNKKFCRREYERLPVKNYNYDEQIKIITIIVINEIILFTW